MNMIVVGCGRLGAELAYRLYQKGHRVAVIDQTANAFNNLPSDFLGRTIEGEVLNKGVLQRAGIEHADGLAVVTNSDSLNAVVAHIAHSEFHLTNVVVRNYDPNWRNLHEAFDLQVISSSSWGAQRIEELLYHAEMHTVFSAGNGEVEIYEFSVPKTWSGHLINELIPDKDCSPVGLTRAGRAILPSRETPLQENDILLVSATLDGIDNLRQRLKSQTEE